MGRQDFRRRHYQTCGITFMHRRHHLTFYEFSGVAKDGQADRFTSRQELGLSKVQWSELADISKDSAGGGQFLDLGDDRVRGLHYVGCLAGETISVEVLPKLLRTRGETSEAQIVANLSYMLELVYDLDVFDSELLSLEIDQAGFLEAYIAIFAARINRILRHGRISKRYVTEEDDIRLIRGKINIIENLRKIYVDSTKMSCVFDEFSSDWLLNQALKYVSARLLRLTKSTQSAKNLKSTLALMDGIEPKWHPPTALRAHTASIRDRELIGIIRLTEMFLSGLRPSMRTQKLHLDIPQASFAIIFDMNELFEGFFYRALAGVSADLGLDVKAQKRIRMVKAERTPADHGWVERERFDTFSDLVLTPRDGRSKLVIDTKYKLLDLDKSHFGISNADVYQILAYEMIHRHSTVPGRGMLIYPQVGDQPIRIKYKLRGGLNEFAVASVDISKDLRRGMKAIRDEIKEIVSWAFE
jgi:5-methylcytosine-specific restriction enzyme subunit McrC